MTAGPERGSVGARRVEDRAPYGGEERLGCFGWFCAVIGITPARVASRRAIEQERAEARPRVISLEKSAGASADGSGKTRDGDAERAGEEGGRA
ncbi:MAG: hypothetical protein AAF297_08705 [Planctomycetota bacterium]